MNIGDYVRTKKGIAKIIDRVNDPTNYFYKFWVCDRYLELHNDTEYIHEKDIIGEPSLNIIDLIEVGDYVNEHKVVEVDLDDIDDYGNNFRYIKTEHDFTLNNWVKENEIETILTREQFESMKYKVNE